MTFPGRRATSVDFPKANRPLRGGPIPVTEDDLPFYAALVGRAPNADDRTAVLLSGFELSGDQMPVPGRWKWRSVVGWVRGSLASLRRAN